MAYYLQIGMDEALKLEEESSEAGYHAFVDKFKPKKTTDDCYTPENIMDVVNSWVHNEYGIDPARFIRPFWPGADYERAEYPEGCVVVDNPPFSILAKIASFYAARRVAFFLFAPALTILNSANAGNACCVCVGVSITYANGAQVPTSFITNLDSARMRTAPELYCLLHKANQENEKKGKAELPKYEYPDHIVTAAIAQRWSKYGVAWRVERDDSMMVRELDAQKESKKGIFGAGLLLSERAAAERAAAERAAAERAAAERAAAERAAAHKWRLSDREKRLVDQMGKD